jgi:hypothetical protein
MPNPVHTNYDYSGETIDVFAALSARQLHAAQEIVGDSRSSRMSSPAVGHYKFAVSDRERGDSLCACLRAIGAEHYRSRVYGWQPTPDIRLDQPERTPLRT